MDFKQTLMQSLTSARGLSGNRSKIRTVLDKFSADILEATESKVLISYRAMFGQVIDLESMLSDIVFLDGATEEKTETIYIHAKGIIDNKTATLGKFSWPVVNGFPCHVEFDGSRYIAQDTEELELALKEMLASPFISQKIYNFYIEGQ